MESRIIELEIKISNQEKLIDELNQVLYTQWRDIDQLKKQVDYLINLLKSSDQKVDQNEKPPHY